MVVRRSIAVLLAAALASAAIVATAGPATATPTCGRVANDFNGDGYADVAIGIPETSFGGGINGAGSIQVDYGGSNGIVTSKTQYFDQDSPGVPGTRTTSAGFGSTLVSGYFNGDCYADLAIGLAGSGGVIVLYGSATGLTTTGAVSLAAPTGQAGFGAALAAGDFNNDGYADLAVGAPGTTDAGKANAGAVDIFAGGSSGLSGSSAPITQSTDGIAGTSETSDAFGDSLAAGDFNHDGYADLAIGTPGESDGSVRGAGAIRVLNGTSSGPTGVGSATITQATAGVPGVNEDSDHFGSRLAAGDVNGDGDADLVVGVIDESIGTVDEAGDIAELPGSSAGITGAGTIRYSQATPGVPGDPSRFGEFGFSVAVGDFNHDGFGDIAVGVTQDTPVGSTLPSGSVLVFNGSAAGPSTTGVTELSEHTPGVPGTESLGDFFGEALLAADLRGTGRPDLVVSAPQTVCANGQEECGSVYVLRSANGTGLTGTGATTIPQSPDGPGPVPEGHYGISLG